MALRKAYTDPYGVAHASAYWRIIGFTLDMTRGSAVVELAAYHDADARQAGKAMLPGRVRHVFQDIPVPEGQEGEPGTALTAALAALDGSCGLRPYLYEVAKALPDFAGAEDC